MSKKTRPSTVPTIPPERAIARIRDLMAEIDAVDISTISGYSGSEVEGLETRIRRTLADAFGDDTRDYYDCSPAASLSCQVLDMTGTRHRDEQTEARRDFVRQKPRSIKLLQTAIKLLEYKIADAGHTVAAPEQRPKTVPRTTGPNIHIGAVYGPVGNIGAGNVMGDMGQLCNGAEERSRLDQIGRDVGGIMDLFAKLRAEASQSPADSSKLQGLVTDLRNALSGAAGSIAAAGLGKLFG